MASRHITSRFKEEMDLEPMSPRPHSPVTVSTHYTPAARPPLPGEEDSDTGSLDSFPHRRSHPRDSRGLRVSTTPILSPGYVNSMPEPLAPRAPTMEAPFSRNGLSHPTKLRELVDVELGGTRKISIANSQVRCQGESSRLPQKARSTRFRDCWDGCLGSIPCLVCWVPRFGESRGTARRRLAGLMGLVIFLGAGILGLYYFIKSKHGALNEPPVPSRRL